MKSFVLIVILLSGCGSVTMVDGADDGAAGDALGAKPEVKPDVVVTEVKPEVAVRPLGAGCTEDSQCGSGMCVAGACCNGRPGTCSACVGGYVTPVADAPTGCGTCRAGKLVDVVADGESCGEPTCSGPKDVMGFPGGVNVNASSDEHVCRAGACVAKTTDCRAVVCPASCKVQYQGCVTDTCLCVGTDGSVCN